MISQRVVFGGWGIDPAVLKPLFGDAVYIDINAYMLDLLDGSTLRATWPELFCNRISNLIGQPHLLAGWSTGAIIAAGVAGYLKPKALIAISATGSFCRTASHPSGVRPAVLKAMRIRLSSDPSGVLRDFALLCGLPPDAATTPASPDALIAGLHVLEQLSLAGDAPLACPSLFIHGKDDAVIPAAAGELFCTRLGGTMHIIDGAHACFTTNTTEIKTICTSFFGGYHNEHV